MTERKSVAMSLGTEEGETDDPHTNSFSNSNSRTRTSTTTWTANASSNNRESKRATDNTVKIDAAREPLPKAGEFRVKDYRASGSHAGWNKDTVRVVCWNILRGWKIKEVVQELRRLDADIICLQECDIFTGRCDNSCTEACALASPHRLVDCCAEIGGSLQLNTLAAVEMSFINIPGVQTNAILTKFDFDLVGSVPHRDLPMDMTVLETATQNGHGKFDRYGLRTAAKAIVRSPMGGILVYSDHFEMRCSMENRLFQLNTLFDDCKQTLSENNACAALLTGDLNTFCNGVLTTFKWSLSSDLSRACRGVANEPQLWETVLFPPPNETAAQERKRKRYKDSFTKAYPAMPSNELGFVPAFPVSQHTITSLGGLYKQKLDWILTKGCAVKRKWVGNTDASMSDHYYLVVDFHINDLQAATSSSSSTCSSSTSSHSSALSAPSTATLTTTTTSTTADVASTTTTGHHDASN